MTRELKDAYNTTKKRQGVVTSLPWRPEPSESRARSGAPPARRRVRREAVLVGRWRIVWMEGWDQDFVDQEVEALFELKAKGMGHFQFGYVQGGIDYRETKRDGKPAVEFSWDGNDEMEPAQGRGWAVLDGDGIEGRIFFHRGDEVGVQGGSEGALTIMNSAENPPRSIPRSASVTST